MKWEEVKLGEFADVLSGYAYKSSDFCNSGVPVVKITNVKPPIISLEEVSYISEEFANAKQQYILEHNDVLIAMTGSHVNQMNSVVGRVGRVKYEVKSVLNQRVGKIYIKDNSRLDLTFLYYYLGQEKIKFELANVATGSANQANISPNNIRALLIPCPPLEIQQRIASILSAYDELIENNQKQIKLLEEAAQRLYKEWFVDLRFPGHEDVEIVDGLPVGWEWKRLGEVCETYGGGTPSTKEPSYYDNGNLLWVTPTDITRNSSLVLLDTEKKITEEGLKNSSAKMVPEESILMTSRASVGYFGVCEKSVCTNQGFISCVPNQTYYQMYLLYNLMNRVDEIRQKAGGSTYLEISKKTFRDLDIVLPDTEILKEFQKIEYKIFEESRNLAKKIVCLKEVRDRLLQKLMSGEIEV